MFSTHRWSMRLLLPAAVGILSLLVPPSAGAVPPGTLHHPVLLTFGSTTQLGLGAAGGVVGAQAPDGSIFGFVGGIGSPVDSYPIQAYSWTPSVLGTPTTRWTDTNYLGHLIGATYNADNRHSYVLYTQQGGLWLGGHDEVSGAVDPAIEMTTRYNGQGADITVHRGQVLVIWTQSARPAPAEPRLGAGVLPHPSSQLFARDNAARPGRSVQLTVDGTDNTEPNLTASPDGSAVELAWTTRRVSGQVGTSIGIGNNAGRGWTFSLFPTGGLRNDQPAVAYDGTTAYLAWLRDGQVTVADTTGTPVHTLGPSTSRPSIATSDSLVHVGYTLDGQSGPFAELAERLAIGWTSEPLPDPYAVVLGIFSSHGRARLLVHEELHDYAIVTQK